MRKVYTEITISVVLRLEDDVEVADAINDLDWTFTLPIEKGDIGDTSILDYEIKDSK